MLIAMANLGSQWSLSNPGRDALLVWLEPWAEEFVVPARSTVAMRAASGRAVGEIEWTLDHLIVWASAPTVEVFIDGVLQDSGSATIPIPEGLTKGMLNILFAGQPAARLGGAHVNVDERVSLWGCITNRLRW
ncbi:hypothetical protein [Sphingopyxis sp. JAI128]|uniref:hypothetical protein n=1 Tax=Sphingopyxis sp. JAI128 TaxID=2723066 RepID=UPI0016143F29|nr:hypothetical protein [Sphingopyxis sp. JAI128]MBB6426706.1 hypothetical protein [Sphingopyxis sp. JAI128]